MNIELRNISIICGKEIRDAFRNRWFLLISLIFTGLSLGFSFMGSSGLGNLGISGFGRTTMSLLNLVLLVVPLMALLLGSISLAGEREHGTLRSLLAQPVNTAEIFLGKFTGTAAALTLTLLAGFGFSGLVVGFYGGPSHIGIYLTLLACTVLLGLVFLAAGFCVSVLSSRTATAIGVALFLWFLFMVLSDLGMMGSAVVLKLAPRDFFWLTLLNPAQCFKMATVGLIQGDLDILGPAGRYAVDSFGNGFPWILTTVLTSWGILPLGVSLWLFKKQKGE